MSRRLLVSWLPGETRAALQCDGRLTRLVVQRRDRPRLTGNIYLGRVTALRDDLAAALVDIGAGRDALLPLGSQQARPSPGDGLPVEVVREAGPGKGARLRICPPALTAELIGRLGTVRPPALLRRGTEALAALLGSEPLADEVWVDQAAALNELKRRYPDRLAHARLAPDGAGLFEREGLEAEIEMLLCPYVVLPSGGSLLIEPVSSMIPIDVNSGAGGDTGGAVGRALAVDQEAADEIPRQLLLRALGGLVVVDFLELPDRRQRQAINERLRRGLMQDSVPSRVQPMRPSGLVELTRRRVGPALYEILTEPCGLGGAGRRKSAVTLAYEAVRVLLRTASANPGKSLTLAAETRVVGALEGALSDIRSHAESVVGRPCELRATDSRGAPAFEVVIGSKA